MVPIKETSKTKYHEAVGRRKTSAARVRIVPARSESWDINGRDLSEFFPVEAYARHARLPLSSAPDNAKFRITVKVSGGGASSQAGAIRHGLARALSVWQPELKPSLKKDKFLTRDPRMKERRKFGLKKARRAPQWSKR